MPTTPGRPAIDQQHWQQRLAELAAEHQVPGAVLAVLRVGPGPGTDGPGTDGPGTDGPGTDDDELVEAATGVLNTSTGVEVTTDSVFQIGSISKVCTTTLVMQLVDEGRLDLDAPIADVLPDLQLGDPEVARRVTMRHLLTHTSGIDGDIFTDTGRGDDAVQRYVAALADAPQNHPLGATFSYCNSGFALAGRVVEVVTGQTWDTVLRERLIEPLGLRHTSTLPEEAILHRVAVGHLDPDPDADPHERPTPASTWVLPRSLGPAGLINATARDVTSFARLHLRGGVGPDGTRLLSAASTAAMQAHEADLPDPHSLGDSWGLGWMRFDWHGVRLYGHDGTTIGQHAYLRVLPAADGVGGLAVALTTNGGHGADLFHALYREVFGELAGVRVSDPLAPAAEAPDVDLARYVGSYERTSVRTEVFQRDGGLVARVVPSGAIAESSGQTTEELELHPVSPGVFATRAPGYRTWTALVFYTLPDGARYLHHGVRANPRTDR